MTKNMRILLIDRDIDFINKLTNFLLVSGYRNVLSVSNYNDALTVLKLNHYDIVLMEIFAPDKKGLDYAWEIKRLKPETKILLMIEPEHQPIINGKTKGKIKFDCLMKSTITQNLLGHLKG